MRLHHDKHHQTYTDKLNEALAKHPEIKIDRAEDLIINLEEIPQDIRTAVRNHGGGYVNHNFFWSILGAPEALGPAGELLAAIDQAFGSFELLKAEFTQAALGQFGSGWAWLVLNPGQNLEIMTSPNQDSPLSLGAKPLLTIDVWEHAYYLKYQNRRADWIAAWWYVVNWEQVQNNFEAAREI